MPGGHLPTNQTQEPHGTEAPATDYIINNDYLYPRYTEPAMLRKNLPASQSTSFGSTSSISGNGLLRGWIYPVDVRQANLQAGLGADTYAAAKTAMQTAEDERTAAAQAALLAAQAAVPLEFGQPERTPANIAGASQSPVTQNYTIPADVPKQIRFREGKQFQFNPFSIGFNIEMNITAPAETQQQGGTGGTAQVGGVTTTVELLFDRTIETNAATRGVERFNGHKVDPIFKHIGVQKDIWDVYRIILGGDENYWASLGSKLVNINQVVTGAVVARGSVTEMAQRLFDLGIQGAAAFGRRIALFYNPNIVILGDVTSIGLIYAEFNSNYVPIKAKIDLGLSILSSSSESGIDQLADDATTPTDEDDEGSNGTSGDDTQHSSSDDDNYSTAYTNYQAGI